ncbi:MAG: hypothetical protein IKW30_10110 [Lachnospiraceae bacterium]|nr:hypothetical protein [Lachnospiraceae bacterium]
MLVVIASWIYYFALCLLIGIEIEQLLVKLLKGKWKFQIIDFLVTGIVGITIYASFFSLFYKVGMIAHIVLFLGAVYSGLRNKEFIKRLGQDGKKIVFSWEGFFFFCMILAIAFFTSRGNFHTDTNIYHAQNIRLYEEYGIIKGMANLQLHYGYNSLYLAFAAIMSLSWLLPWSLHTTTGFIEIILCLYALHHLKGFRKHTVHLEDAGCVAILLYAFVNVTGSMSPATDYPTMFLTIYMITVWLRAIEKRAHYCVYALLSVFGVFLGTMKLSAIAMAFVVIYPACILIQKKKWKEIVIYIGMGILVLAPYLIRNVILSGWLIYPFEAIDIFDVDWKVPLEYLLVDANQIKVWGRCLYNVALIDMPMKEWIPIWLEHQERYEQMLLLANIVSLVLSGYSIFYQWLKKLEIRTELLVLYIGLLTSAVLWFVMAPFIRYGLGFLLVLPILGIAVWFDGEKKGLYSIVSGCMVLLIFLCFTSYIDRYFTDAGVFVKQRLMDPYYVVQKDYDDGSTKSVVMNGNTIYYNDYIKEEGERNSYHYFPNTCYEMMLNRTTLVSENMKDGFIPKSEGIE